MSKVNPITPLEVVKAKGQMMPNFVIEAFNQLIAKHWDGFEAIVKQKEVADLICDLGSLENNRPIYDGSWLNVEDIYRAAGWTVVYDKPAYNETYEPTFKFTKNKAALAALNSANAQGGR